MNSSYKERYEFFDGVFVADLAINELNDFKTWIYDNHLSLYKRWVAAKVKLETYMKGVFDISNIGLLDTHIEHASQNLVNCRDELNDMCHNYFKNVKDKNQAET